MSNLDTNKDADINPLQALDARDVDTDSLNTQQGSLTQIPSLI